MWLAGICFALVSTATVQAFAQNIVPEWLPVHIGDKWVYEHATRDEIGEGRARLDTHSWKTEETTVNTWTVPEGTVLEKHVQVAGGTPPAGWRVYADQIYLIRRSCLYEPAYGEAKWNPATRRLTEAFVEGLRGSSSPDFCFPLDLHKTWGAPSDWHVAHPEEARDWQVMGTKVHDPLAPDKGTTFHITNISSYPGSGMTVDIWFEKGVGVVREDEIHHGTVGEERTRLLSFSPAQR